MPRETARPTDHPLGSQRQRFVSALEPRLAALTEASDALAAHPEHVSLRDRLEQRLEAMSDAANALGFEQMAAAFASAQSALACATDPSSTARAVADAKATLQLIPTLVESPELSPLANDATATIPSPPPTEPPPAPEAALPLDHLRAAAVAPLRAGASLAPGTVVVLGVLPLRSVSKSWAERFPELCFHFTVDLEDAEALAKDATRPALIIDGRRPDVGHAFHRLCDLGPCVIVEATAKQQRGFEAQGAHAAVPTRSSVEPVIEELFAAPTASTKPDAPLNDQSEATPAQQPEIGRGHVPRTSKADVMAIPGRTVLIADADPATAWFLTGLLRSVQATVLEARDGLEAWQLARERIPDLIISDVALPELDGFGLCRNIKRDVALSDVPVLLVSWKEDALHRVRELGAGADGYFIKEADSATVLRRCAEALQTRVNVERRLRAEGTVRGRLEGMTPRLVLRLASELAGEARVTFTDAAYTYVAYVGDGRLLSATRRGPDGEVSGESVLPSILGMRASRFVVEPHAEVVQSSFFGSMSATLAPSIAKIRRATRVLAGDALHKVARVDLDVAVVEAYTAAAPSIARRLVEKLTDGVPPFALARSVTGGLLESVLADLALRGAVRSAVDVDDNDLLESEDVFTRPFDVDLRTPTTGVELQAAAGAPRITASSTHEEAQKAADFAGAQVTKPDTVVAMHSARGFGDLRVPEAPAKDPTTFELANASEQAAVPLGPQEQPTQTRPRTLIPRPEPSEAPVDWAPTPKELLQTAESSDARDLAIDECEALAAAASTEQAGESPLPTTTTSTPEPEQRPDGATTSPAVPVVALTTQPEAGLDSNSEPPSITDPAAPQGSDTGELAQPEPEGVDLADAIFDSTFAPFMEHENASVGTGRDAPPPSDPSQSSESELVVSTSLRATGTPLDDDFVDAEDPLFSSLHLLESEPSARANTIRTNPLDVGESTAPPKAVSERKLSLGNRISGWSQRTREVSKLALEWSRRRRRESQSEGLESNGAQSDSTRTGDSPPTANAGAVASSPRESDSPPKSPSGRWRAAATKALPAAAALGAAALAFSGVGAIVERIESTRINENGTATIIDMATPARSNAIPETAAADPTLPEAIEHSVAPPGTKTEKARVQMNTTDLPLPDDVQIASDKGLLEVNSGDGHKIYVNGVFVGRGPVRRVPLSAGKHAIELRQDGEIDSFDVTISAGKRVRLEPAAHASAAR